MPKLIIEDFKIGLDRRRMNETSLPGSLIVLENGHITRGGEIEKSEAYIRFTDLPANTYGLKAVRGGFLVFGSDDITPTLLSSNPPVRYQRLFDPAGNQSFASFTMASQVAGNTFTSIKVGAVELLPSTSTCPSVVANWPEELTALINTNSLVSGFKATVSGSVITVSALTGGTTANGAAFTFTKTGAVTATPSGTFAGGTAATNPNMIRVLSVDLYDGKAYVIAEYDDGVIRHWFNGIKVQDFFSGKSRAKFSLSSTGSPGAKNAKGSFLITASDTGGTITSILVGTVELLASAVVYETNPYNPELEDFPRAVADAINANSNQSGFNADIQSGQKVIITAAIPGTAVNGQVIAVASSGAVTIQSVVNMAGGSISCRVTDITINAVSIFEAGVDVDWAESDSETAIAVAATINNYTQTSGYEAVAYGTEILIRRNVDGTAVNGHAVNIVTTNNASGTLTATPASTTMSGGAGLPTIIEPGRFIKTMKRKTYVLTGPSLYYSNVDDPDNFTGDVGAGFDNLSTNTSGAEELTSLANYFDNLAIFSRNIIQVWFVTDDPDQNQQLQVLNNTGTIAPNSVTEFGDNDVFFLSQSGIRSIRARDANNAAFVNDVGIAIDELIQNEILENNAAAVNAIGFLDPRQGRYNCIIGNKIYVFSYFPTGKISAWSTYNPGFSIEAIDFLGQTVVCRSRNALYKIGSTIKRVYDSRQTKIITPFLDANDPTLIKDFTGIDIACEGTWDIYAATDVLQVDEDGYPLPESFEIIATVTGSTYNETGGENGACAWDASCTHVALMLINRTAEYARVGNIALHYSGSGK